MQTRPYARRPRQDRLKPGWKLISMLAVLILSTIGVGTPASAQVPPDQTYWLARMDGTDYVYDIPVPAVFVPVLTAAGSKNTAFKSFPKLSSKEIDGQTYNFVTTEFGWDLDTSGKHKFDQGRFAYARDGVVQDVKWWTSVDGTSPEWKAFASEVKAQATEKGNWRYVDLTALISTETTTPTLRVPIPETTLATMKMSELAKQTSAGTYYPDVKVPSDLAAYQQAMLDYGNAGRRDPNFRKDHGAKYATDLTQDTVATKGSVENGKPKEKVFRLSDTPPYFPDHVMNDTLNKMAQFQAEYSAAIDDLGHDGPPWGNRLTAAQRKFQYIDPATGKAVNMYQMGDRSKYFGAPANVVEAGSANGPGGAPGDWMSGETHFRPWFNVYAAYPEIGYGAAQAKSGNWYFFAVAIADDTGETLKDAVQPTVTATSAVTSTTSPTYTMAFAPTECLTSATSDFPIVVGTSLVQGKKYVSPSGNHYLIFQPDGNLVVYTAQNQHYWGLDLLTSNYMNAKTVAMEADGNLVVRDENKQWIWSALSANPDASAILTLTRDGILQLVSCATPAILWASDGDLSGHSENTFPLKPGLTLFQGEKYLSESGDHYLIFETGGNLVVYNSKDEPVWSLEDVLKKPVKAESVMMQTDGNLVVRGAADAFIWSALTKDPDRTTHLILTPAGVLRLVSGTNGAILWASDGNLDAN